MNNIQHQSRDTISDLMDSIAETCLPSTQQGRIIAIPNGFRVEFGSVSQQPSPELTKTDARLYSSQAYQLEFSFLG